MGRAVVLITLAACGRFGFDESESPFSDGGPDATPVRAIHFQAIYGDGADFPQAPVAGAHVVLDDGTTLRTDVDGELDIPAPGPRTFHVVFDSTIGPPPSPWRVVSFYDVPPDITVKLGPRPQDTTLAGKIDFDGPADPGADQYTYYAPNRCGNAFGDVFNATPTFALDFRTGCNGATAQVYVLSFQAQTPRSINATAPFVYDDGGLVPFGTTWTPVAFQQVRAINIPGEINTVAGFRPHYIAGDDVYLLGVSGGAASGEFGTSGPRAVNANFLSFVAMGPAAINSTHQWGPLDDAGDFDASAALPLMGPTGIDAAASKVTWGDPATADLVRAAALITTDALTVNWTIYAPATQREATFPALPAELADLMPTAGSTWSSGTATAILSIDDGHAALLKYVDVDFVDWRNFRRFTSGAMFLSTAIVPP